MIWKQICTRSKELNLKGTMDIFEGLTPNLHREISRRIDNWQKKLGHEKSLIIIRGIL